MSTTHEHLGFDELKREFTRARLLQYAQAQGLKTARGKLQCPVCKGGSGEKADASVSDRDGTGLWHCHRCSIGGSVIDLAQHVLSLPGEVEAAREVEAWLGRAPPAPAPKPRPVKDPAAIWESVAAHTPEVDAYVQGRLGWLPPAALFGANAPGAASDWWLGKRADDGYRLAAPLFAPGGAMQSLQVRAIVPGLDPAKLSLAGCPHKGSAFGDADRSQSARRVVLGEGLMDRLALACLDEVVLTAPGTGGVGDLLAHIGDPKGREVVLCPQNDVDGQSESAFAPLEKKLRLAGAIVRTWRPPEGTKDIADWLRESGAETLSSSFRDTMAVIPLPRSTESRPGQRPSTDEADARSVEVITAPGGELRELTNSFASICHILRTPALREKVFGPGALEFNEQTLEPCIGRRSLLEHESFRVREQCERQFRNGRLMPLQFQQGDVDKAILLVAREHTFHPVAEYLRSLVWDGQPRISRLAAEVLDADAESSEELSLAGTILRCWFIAAVRRALDPGCKVDNVLVLVGPQGSRKSTFFRTLAGPVWFSDSTVDIHDKDSKLLLRRVWVLEWAELESMQRARSVNSVKSFITSSVDHLRPPYARAVGEFPRTCIIVGTTNERRFLVDETGNRRYWAISNGAHIDIDTLATWRDQLWAEATHACAAHERHFLDADEDAALARVQSRFEQTDVWEERIWDYVQKQERAAIAQPITTAVLLEHALAKNPGQWIRSDEMRIAAILTRAGWSLRRPRVPDGRRLRAWEPPPRPDPELPMGPGAPPTEAAP